MMPSKHLLQLVMLIHAGISRIGCATDSTFSFMAFYWLNMLQFMSGVIKVFITVNCSSVREQ